ncbi:hypothetical protein K435DRAFT_701701 [Dendrothele bispora CBS 962.96]|uniref:CxC1-like cysteine cluster associated with KDZ transposases domain-containing protein n=1 Tax=Dendrothele bispora (strain CBS 962.96) TaxID=1314807 RepID=A0A4S8KPW4_DENBC|nr:hypothetical protein K435DRAFT_701701 [Dendrothele bispora CBS 962.96]
MEWDFNRSKGKRLVVAEENVVITESTRVIAVFCEFLSLPVWLCYSNQSPKDSETRNIYHFKRDTHKSASIVRQGFFPSSPLLHNTVFDTTLLQLYHRLSTRCPRLAIQPFVKSLCDLHGYAYQPYFTQQFTQSYDLYLAVIASIRKRVRQKLGRDDSNWRVLNTCPACQTEVVGEKNLGIGILTTMDGNDSLKRLDRREGNTTDENGLPCLGADKERPDPRDGGDDYFLKREEVDKWDRENWEKNVGNAVEEVMGDVEEFGCEQRWKNMKESVTAVMLGKYNESGIFVLLCRHGSVLLMADMVRSGEQHKYPLAIVNKLLSIMEKDRIQRQRPPPETKVGIGYDCGCKLKKTIERSPLKDLAKKQCLEVLIGILHGHGHGRTCQLDNLLLYKQWAGSEDLEGCERFFSKSNNNLAGATRYASKFHRRQTISEYAYHNDNFEVYANLSNFLVGKYRQVLATIATWSEVQRGMREQNIVEYNVFFQWLDEEREFLRSRKKVPEQETLEMDYYKLLAELKRCQYFISRETLSSLTQVFLHYNPSTGRTNNAGLRKKVADEREIEMKLLRDIQVLEAKLEIGAEERWKPDSAEWQAAEGKAKMADYQAALDKLEGLLVARIFELSKTHLAGTGYKMRRHILTAVKKRSKTIRTALNKYNAAAAALSPPRPAMKWEEVLENSFLSEFDILRDTRDDIRKKDWAKPANRQLQAEFFKVVRALEEKDRLHVEIKRLITYIKEETLFLLQKEREIEATNPALAYQMSLIRWERGRFNSLHHLRLQRIFKMKGFEQADRQFFRAGMSERTREIPASGEVREEVVELADGEDLEEDDDGEDDDEVGRKTEVLMSVGEDREKGDSIGVEDTG